jgi:hypothetical protein
MKCQRRCLIRCIRLMIIMKRSSRKLQEMGITVLLWVFCLIDPKYTC